MELVLNLNLGRKVILEFFSVICLGSILNGSQIAWIKISMHGPQSTRATKCAAPCKVRGPTQSARTALWVRGTPNAWTRAKCVGRGSIARAALSARTAIARSSEWAALSTHLPRTCHAMPTQCNRGSTRVGRDEPQSPGTLRVNVICKVRTDTYVQNTIPIIAFNIYAITIRTFNIETFYTNVISDMISFVWYQGVFSL